MAAWGLASGWRGLGEGLDRRILWLVTAILGWTALATALSTNHLLSVFTLAWVAAAVVVFLAAYGGAKRGAVWPLSLLLAGGVINAVIFMLQELDIWSPFVISASDPRFGRHLTNPALLGNPNDVGVYLVAPAIAAIGLALAGAGRVRWLYGGAAVIMTGAVFVSSTLTAVGALGAGILTFGITRFHRKGLLASLALLAIGVVAITAHAPAREKLLTAARLARAGQLNAALSNRLGAFAAAAEMIKDRPVTGVGPGTFGWQFLPYRLRAEETNPDLLRAWNRHVNFAEAHNDHLQTAAVAGIPAYGLFVASLVILGRRSFVAPQPSGTRSRFATLTAFPLAVAFAVVTLAQFPLELAAPLNAYLVIAAACLAWSEGTA